MHSAWLLLMTPVLGRAVSPQIHVHPEPVDVTLLGNRASADVLS